MSVLSVKSEQEYGQLISSDKLSVALFSADWAEQCEQIKAVLAELVKQDSYKDVQFLDVPAEELSEISMKHKIEAVPTVIFFRSNKAVDRVDGVDIAALTAKVNKFAGIAAATVAAKQTQQVPLEERLRALINQAKVMIFMKGNRDAPRCGFSKELIRIVNETSLPYETFDILGDEEVRQGLKTFSDWPTYPQVYVNGELIGGLDIIKELVAGGELTTTLSS